MGGRSDAELLAAHRAGDPRAFAELDARYRKRLWGIALRTLGHPEDAADVVQETLLAAFRRADGYRGDASVRTWLHRILVNACIDRIRRENRHRTVPLPEAEPRERGADVASDVVTRLSVDAALAELPAHQRVAVVLVDVHGWPVEEVAQVLEVPVGTVKSRCARARLRLGALLGHVREEER
ncbi:MAG TPA: RNA polymerase sigma factor SigM [Pseudonocardia sp.]|jgi:RNA polymerase sigma-70 factor (ECF subfamily)|uniref:RNA polymerase sigma factor SigM n=1 Tax=Pseudonocardia sp. TaxID=60912 RepID=UPI002B4AFEFF|nr:RNA polymerase sigma factor SigM [Pseudonocardia sp.]HLU57177.1 RNA polymerase sigma factor SigM [Pseudonocardia sp.]